MSQKRLDVFIILASVSIVLALRSGRRSKFNVTISPEHQSRAGETQYSHDLKAKTKKKKNTHTHSRSSTYLRINIVGR